MIHARASATALNIFWGGGRSKSEWEACLYVNLPVPRHAQQVAVSWVDWDDTVGTFNVNFGKFYTCSWVDWDDTVGTFNVNFGKFYTCSWVDWDDTVGTFNVNFGKFYTWAQLLDDILDFDIR